MSAVNEICRRFREASLPALESAPAVHEGVPSELREHAATCAPCRLWVARAEEHARAFQRLREPMLAAPPALDERVAAELEALAASRAPEEPVPLGIQALKTLTCHPAPAVLDRLVVEELEKPALHRTNRFTDLEKMRAPDQLAVRLERGLQRSLLVRRALPLVAGLAAAGLVAWLALARTPAPADRSGRTPSFEVVRSDTLDDFHPWVRAGFGALAVRAEEVR